MNECLMCEEPLPENVEGLELCRDCALTDLPRLLAVAVLADPRCPSAFEDLSNALKQVESIFWKEATCKLDKRLGDTDNDLHSTNAVIGPQAQHPSAPRVG